MVADNRCAKDLVFAGHRKHLDQAFRRLVGDCTVEIVDAVGGQLIFDIAFPGFGLVQADPCNLRVGKGRPGDHGIVDLELSEATKQGVDRGIPGRVGRHVGELVGPGDVAAGVDIGIVGLHVFVDHNRSSVADFDADVVGAVAGHIRRTADRNQHLVEGDVDGLAIMFCDQMFFTVNQAERLGLGVDAYIDAFIDEALPYHL